MLVPNTVVRDEGSSIGYGGVMNSVFNASGTVLSIPRNGFGEYFFYFNFLHQIPETLMFANVINRYVSLV